jgi:outer membrane protein assembly factor BamD (BamD/ComL family)
VGLLFAIVPGCTSGNVLLTQFVPPWKLQAPEAREFPKPGTKDSLVLTGGGLEKGFWHPRQEDLQAAKQLIEEKKFAEGEKAFHVIAVDKKCPEQFREEALFYEGECQRLQKHYRASEETYAQLFKDHPSTQFTERADRGLFEIADHWLGGTREQMEAYAEQREGKRWLVMPVSFIHLSQDMPIFDVEGHAVRVLEGIQMREKVLHTPLGEQALLYLGTLRFFREDYLDADRYFTDLYQHYPNSPKAADAVKKSIICKQLCTCGTCYDLRTVEESRKLIHTAQTAYPELSKDREWISQQLVSINLQQADRDWRIAEHYRWTNHPGAAYFYYELVRRCYPNTDYAAKAGERIRELEQRHPEAVRPAQPGSPPAASVGPPVPSGPAPPRVLPPSLAPPM